MNADPLAQIRPALSEALAGGKGCCVTFQAAGDDTVWIQYVDQMLNCAHPHRSAPALDAFPARLRAALDGVEIGKWEAQTFATYLIGNPKLDPLAELVDAIFTGSLGCAPGGYRLDISFEQL